jgi:low affinity Fe/Cu permease
LDIAAWPESCYVDEISLLEEIIVQEAFHKFSIKTAEVVGSPAIFFLSCVVILLWLATGPVFGFSDTWQLVVNTATSVITFLMVFIIQNTQNRDTKVLQLKLDELLRAVEGARTSLVNMEKMSDEDLAKLQKEFERLSRRNAPPPLDQAEA